MKQKAFLGVEEKLPDLAIVDQFLEDGGDMGESLKVVGVFPAKPTV